MSSYRSLEGESILSGWSYGGNRTANEAILSCLEKLQSQSSDQIRNDALASAAINNMVTGTVGSGLKPQPAIDCEFLSISDEKAHEFSRKAERLFQWWAISKTCDFSRNHTFWEMEALLIRSTLEFGDSFVLKRKRSSSPILDLSLQMIEAPRVKTPLEHSSPYMKAGLELSQKTGEIAAIYVSSEGKTFLPEFIRVSVHDADGHLQLIHLANKKRIDQSRGIPYLATVTPLMKQLSRFAEGETAAAVLNSFLAFVTKTRDGSSPLGDSGVVGGGKKRQVPQKISPQMNVHLREGESIEMLDPKRPNSNFSSFFDAIVKLIGAELEIPFEVLISSFNSSYSASRAAMVKAFQVYKLRRKWLVENFHKQVWDWFIEDCILKGHLDAPGFFDDPIKRLAYTSCDWVGDSSLQLDPVKEANGAGKLYELGVISKKTLTQLLTGQNYENVVEQRRKEGILEKELFSGSKSSSSE